MKKNKKPIIKHQFIKEISLYDLEGDLQEAINRLQSELNYYSNTHTDLILDIYIDCGGCSCCSSETWSFELKGRPKNTP